MYETIIQDQKCIFHVGWFRLYFSLVTINPAHLLV